VSAVSEDVVTKVQAMVMSIPAGCVAAYGEIGLGVGIGPRQAGRIVAQLSDEIPWWRVVYADGTPATCHGDAARALLDAEGVHFRGNRVDMNSARLPNVRPVITQKFDAIRRAIIDDDDNASMRLQGWQPVYAAGAGAKIAVVGQAPGRHAQASGIPWDDASGRNLISWLGVTETQFRNPDLFTLLPMDFYYPGKGKAGDLAPRQGFATRWHSQLLTLMPNIQLTLLIGRYAQLHYLQAAAGASLTDSVRRFSDFIPTHFPLVHPSPLNFRWQARNPWFVTDVLPALRMQVSVALEETTLVARG
jgi:uracil-DNA glycosylase/alkylated DNA nucleotide flippase Atl1